MTVRNLIQKLLLETSDLDAEIMISSTTVDAFGDRETEYFNIDTISNLERDDDLFIQLYRK